MVCRLGRELIKEITCPRLGQSELERVRSANLSTGSCASTKKHSCLRSGLPELDGYGLHTWVLGLGTIKGGSWLCLGQPGDPAGAGTSTVCRLNRRTVHRDRFRP